MSMPNGQELSVQLKDGKATATVNGQVDPNNPQAQQMVKGVESQNAEASPRGSTAGRSVCAKPVPDVPKLTTTGPSATAPTPSAAIMLSPPPALTGMPRSSPSSAAARGRS